MTTTETLIQITQVSGPVKEDSYIVKLKPGTDKQEHLAYIDSHIHGRVEGECEITCPSWNPRFFNGYAGIFSGPALDALCRLTDIEYIEPDQIGSGGSVVTQRNAPWGLSRLSQNTRVLGPSLNLGYKYKYDETAGQGVDIYILDSGIYINNNDFGWRAMWGTNVAANTTNIDVTGHGTHCAGTAVGTQFGVAKLARVIAVKVLGDDGKGLSSVAISGLDWTTTNAYNSGRPCVISMSIGYGYSVALNEAANTATSWGFHVVAAAMNDNKDASTISPASAKNVITVGATTIDDARADFSNFGSSVDIFAPGKDITSCGIKGPSSTAVLSGTSMATPHVSGLIACLIARNGNIAPAAMKAKLLSMSMHNILTEIPQGTINALARNEQDN